MRPRIAFFSAAPPWGSFRHRQHELAEQLGREFDVLYIERPTMGGSIRLRTEPVAPGVELFRPWGPFPPARVVPPLNWIARRLEIRAVQPWLDRGRAVVWIDEDLAAVAARGLEAELRIYDAVDEDWTFTRRWNRWNVRRQKRLALEACGLGIAASQGLADQLGRPGGRDPIVIRNAGDPEHFASATEVHPELGALKQARGRPVAGFVGHASTRSIDLDLVETLAGRGEADLVFVGMTEDDVRERLGRYENVHLLGQRPYEELPSLVHGFDVCLIPYRVGGLIDYVFPKKVFEYLAAGRPVVATPMPELADLADVVRIAPTTEAFVSAVGDALRGDPAADPRLARGRDLARENSWDARGETVRALIRAELGITDDVAPPEPRLVNPGAAKEPVA